MRQPPGAAGSLAATELSLRYCCQMTRPTPAKCRRLAAGTSHRPSSGPFPFQGPAVVAAAGRHRAPATALPRYQAVRHPQVQRHALGLLGQLHQSIGHCGTRGQPRSLHAQTRQIDKIGVQHHANSRSGARRSEFQLHTMTAPGARQPRSNRFLLDAVGCRRSRFPSDASRSARVSVSVTATQLVQDSMAPFGSQRGGPVNRVWAGPTAAREHGAIQPAFAGAVVVFDVLRVAEVRFPAATAAAATSMLRAFALAEIGLGRLRIERERRHRPCGERQSDGRQFGPRRSSTGTHRPHRNGSSSTPTKSVALSFVAGCGPRPSLYAISSARAPRIKPGWP
jgi:hypothetical protein